MTDLAEFKHALLQKEQDLLSDIKRLQEDARQAQQSEVQDEIDEVTSSEVRAATLQENTIEWQTLQQVRAALLRIDDGTYGKCIDCGRDILPARLKAVPWTPYCIQDQQKHDAEDSSELR